MHAWHEFCLHWALFGDAALTGAYAGALLGGLGTFVLLGRMVFVSAALAQVASLGVALGMVARARVGSPVSASVAALSAPLGATCSTAVAAALLALQARFRPRQLEALLGLLFVAGSAGTLVAASYATADLHDIQSLLYGSAVAVLPATRRWLGGLSLALLSATLATLPALAEAWIDPEGARIRGLPLRWLQGWVLLALTVSICACTQALGALPVFAFSVAPALAATARCRTLVTSFGVACALGACAGFLGYVLAFAWAWPVGATQALLAVAAAGAAWWPRRRGQRRRGAF